jgi:hypothetical protein
VDEGRNLRYSYSLYGFDTLTGNNSDNNRESTTRGRRTWDANVRTVSIFRRSQPQGSLPTSMSGAIVLNSELIEN